MSASRLKREVSEAVREGERTMSEVEKSNGSATSSDEDEEDVVEDTERVKALAGSTGAIVEYSGMRTRT